MEKIEAFKLSDGRIVDNEERAVELQKEIDIKKKLSFLCEEYLYGINYEEVVDKIYSKRKEFISALTGL
jgi:hypothetical protein